MWQFLTIDPQSSQAQFSINPESQRHIGSISHALTHRRYRFEVFVCDAKRLKGKDDESRVWTRLDEISAYPLPRPHLKIAQMLREMV